MPASVKFWPQGKRNLLPLKKCSTRVLSAKTFSYVTVYAQDAVKKHGINNTKKKTWQNETAYLRVTSNR